MYSYRRPTFSSLQRFRALAPTPPPEPNFLPLRSFLVLLTTTEGRVSFLQIARFFSLGDSALLSPRFFQ